MRIVIAGHKGQLGTELLRQLREKGSTLGPLPAALQDAEVTGFDIDTLSITDLAALREHMGRERPDAVINCSAYTNVDGCETDPQLAFSVNALGARNMAICCEEIGAKLVHLSTDYVFAGEGTTTPYSEYDLPAPQSVYGKTKWLGEHYVQQFCRRWFVVRTAWLYGYAGNNFVKTILKAAQKNGNLKVVDDQMGNPTNAEDLAAHLLRLCLSEQYGIYHCTGQGVCSWYAFTKEILRLSGVAADLAPCTTEEFPRPAKRPAFSALAHRMLPATVGDDMRPWQQALAVFFENYKGEDIP